MGRSCKPMDKSFIFNDSSLNDFDHTASLLLAGIVPSADPPGRLLRCRSNVEASASLGEPSLAALGVRATVALLAVSLAFLRF
jgi:hypothetical protein